MLFICAVEHELQGKCEKSYEMNIPMILAAFRRLAFIAESVHVCLIHAADVLYIIAYEYKRILQSLLVMVIGLSSVQLGL